MSNIDAHTVEVLAAGALVFLGAFIQYGEAIRLGFKHRTHALPIFANMYFFAHDLVFVARYRHWFHEVGHWMFKAFWLGILVFTVLECVVHWQTLAYSRREVLPQLSQRQYVLAYLAMQAAITVLFFFVHSVLDDPLFLVQFATTEVISNALNIPLLLARRSRKGQSMRLAMGLLIGSNLGFFFFFLPALSARFASLPFQLTGASVTLLNLAYMWALSKFPARAPAALPA